MVLNELDANKKCQVSLAVKYICIFLFTCVYVNAYILKVLYMLLKVNVDAITKTDLTKEFIVFINSLHVYTGSTINLIPRIYHWDEMSIFCVLEHKSDKGQCYAIVHMFDF